MLRFNRETPLLSVIVALSLWQPAGAAQQEDRLRDTVRSLRSQLAAAQQQLSEEIAHSEALRQQAEQSAADARDLQQKLTAQATQFNQISQRAAQAEAQNGQARGVLEQWRMAYDTLGDQAKKIDTERRDFAQQAGTYRGLAEAARAKVTTCTEKNIRLYQIGMDLIAQYRNKSIGSVLGYSEPFFQFSRAKMQNILQGYEDKLYDEKVGVAPASPASPESMPSTSNGK